ncbi:MAG: hypothetical protein ABS81_30435 [Pseudonocardia sp. SCN 72-86]|nr:MAG: hypothetical protein ABS81_30435 [Pseudonocardia sp. SCN 72-86]
MNGPRPRRGRRGAAPVVGVTVVATALAAVAVWDPFHLMWRERYVTVLVTAALVLVVASTVLRVRTTGARVAVVVAGALVVAGWLATAWARSALTPGLDVLAEVGGPPGSRVRLVLGEVRTSALDGRTFSVRVRAGSGAFAQEAAVWTGRSALVPQPRPRFADARTVEMVDGTGCTLRSDVDPVTLGVDLVRTGGGPPGCV